MTATVSAHWTSPTGAQCVATGSGVDFIEVVFTVGGRNLDQRAVDRALTLAVERYCSVGATLAGRATITHRVVVIDADAISAAAA